MNCMRQFNNTQELDDHRMNENCKLVIKKCNKQIKKSINSEIDIKMLYRARVNLMSNISEKRFKKLTRDHIKKYPCDEDLLFLLDYFYDEITMIQISKDKNLYKKFKVKRTLYSESIKKKRDIIKKYI